MLMVDDIVEARRILAGRSLTDFACLVDIPTVPLTDAEDEDEFSVMRLDTLATHHYLICTKMVLLLLYQSRMMVLEYPKKN